MAVIHTPQGRVIGLIIKDDQPRIDTKAENLLAEDTHEPNQIDDEAQEPKRPGRPKKNQ